MSAPSSGQERRQSPRTRVEPLAYISLEPDNGGIVLNVSEGGLCFHCTAAIQRARTIQFWFSTHNSRVEAEGEIAWTDVTQKRGGLRFTNLPRGAREQLRQWISQPLLPEQSARFLVSSSQQTAAVGTGPAEIAVDFAPAAVVQKRSWRGFPSLRGFATGLATGLLISAVLATAFVLRTYRHEIGESLIHWGERMAGRSNPRSRPPATAHTRTNVTSSPAAPVPAPQPVTTSLKPPTNPTPGKEVEPIRVLQPQITHASPTPAPVAPRVSMSAMVGKAPILPVTPATTAVEIAKPGSQTIEILPGRTVAVPSRMYFDVGKFKERVQAQQTADNLAQLGFAAAVIQKKNVWKNSYQVLVGPYSYDLKAEAAHQDLLSRGFPARAVERGSRKFVLRPGLKLNNNHMPAGEYTIRWESYVTHAKVRFVQRDSLVASAEGRWVKNAPGYENDGMIYRINDDGSKTLLEIFFGGMDRALSFR